MHGLARLLLLGLLLFPLVTTEIFASERFKVWVTLKDKGPVLAKSGATPRGMENAPVYKPYVERLQGAGFAVSVTLKWQNRVSGWADSAALAAIRAFPFVTAIEEMPRKAAAAQLPAPRAAPPLAKSSSTGPELFWDFHQVADSVGATVLVDTVLARGLRPGAGVRIAVIDEDFYLGHDMFDSLFARGAIVDQWDFVDSLPQAAFPTLQFNSHGAWVLSLIGGNLPGRAVGLAPYAQFMLYRTEDAASETYVEEDYLAAALERAVDSGAQVINISLGYRYDIDGGLETPYAQMDGRTRPSSIAALGAARRGALVVVAIGNEGIAHPGEASITAPSDADSILSVGIQQGPSKCSYSSTGPTFDGRLKPEISGIGLGGSCGVYVANTGNANGIQLQTGTSFAAPVVAGVAALLRQLHPDSAAPAQKIRRALMITARSSDTANNRIGNGLMRAAQAHCALELDSLVRTPCAPTLPSVAVKGPFVWHGGQLNTLPWPTSLDLTRARMWDLQGRSHSVQGSLTDEGEVRLQSRRRLAPGTFILKIPKVVEE